MYCMWKTRQADKRKKYKFLLTYKAEPLLFKMKPTRLSNVLGIFILQCMVKCSEAFLIRGLILMPDYRDDYEYDEIDSTTSTTARTIVSLSTSKIPVSTTEIYGWNISTERRYNCTDNRYENKVRPITNKLEDKNETRFDPGNKLNPHVYGNQNFIIMVYKYVYPVVLGICLGTMLLFIFILGKQYLKSTRMARSTLVILISVATSDVLTVGFSLAEISYLYKMTSENAGFLPFSACKTMYVLERMSAVPHAASVWLTVVLSAQRYLCVFKPFATRRFVTIRYSVVCVVATSVIVLALHIYRFFDKIFIEVTIPATSSIGKQIGTCRSVHAEWVQYPYFYEDIFMWSRIVIANLLPCIFIIIFVVLMVKILLKSDTLLLQGNKDNAKTQSKRRQLSFIVTVIALIVVCVEMSTGIFLSLYAFEISTGLRIVSYKTFQLTAFAFDIVLYVSYFAVFLIYCLMSKGIRKTVMSMLLPCQKKQERERDKTASSLVAQHSH